MRAQMHKPIHIQSIVLLGFYEVSRTMALKRMLMSVIMRSTCGNIQVIMTNLIILSNVLFQCRPLRDPRA